MNIPDDALYTEEHEWVRIADGKAVAGITDYAQDALGDVVYVELPPVGTKTAFMEPFGVIESVKAASDLYAPVSGKVVEVNTRIEDKPELVNEDPYGEGWMIVVEMSDADEKSQLLSPEAYAAFLEKLEAE